MKERFGFVRGNDNFRGLEDYLNSEELRIKKKRIKYPLQLSLDCLGEEGPAYGLRVRLGYYFELLTQGIYGGRLKVLHELNNGSKNNHDSIRSEPDVTSAEKFFLRESKAVAPGECLKLYDDQIAKYLCLQLGKYFASPPRITFEIYGHGVKKLIRNFREQPLGDLVDSLSASTRFMISLPMSIIVPIHKSGEADSPKHTSRYGGKKWRHNSRLLSSGLNSMLAFPEKTISDFGLDTRDYNIWKLRFSKGMKLNTKKIKPFPVLLVRDKDHRKWIETLREKGSELYSHIFGLMSGLENVESVSPEDKEEELFDEACPF